MIVYCFRFRLSIKFSFQLCTNLEQRKLKGLASKGHKHCQILLFDVHVVHKTPKVSIPQRISEDDGRQAVSSVHSSVQLLYIIINTIVLCRCRPRILGPLYIEQVFRLYCILLFRLHPSGAPGKPKQFFHVKACIPSLLSNLAIAQNIIYF